MANDENINVKDDISCNHYKTSENIIFTYLDDLSLFRISLQEVKAVRPLTAIFSAPVFSSPHLTNGSIASDISYRLSTKLQS
jgi:hypothetical protein